MGYKMTGESQDIGHHRWGQRSIREVTVTVLMEQSPCAIVVRFSLMENGKCTSFQLLWVFLSQGLCVSTKHLPNLLSFLFTLLYIVNNEKSDDQTASS